MQKTIIRLADTSDIEAIAGLLAELFSIEKDFKIDKQKQLDALNIILQEPSSVCIVAVIENEVVGFASMQRVISTAIGGYSGLIEDVIVQEDKRKLGIGNMLLDRLFLEAKLQDFKRLQLLCDTTNTKAQEFYSKHGFKKSQMVGWYKEQ